MDPALVVTSPFHNEGKVANVLDNVITALTAADGVGTARRKNRETDEQPGRMSRETVELHGTSCSMCSKHAAPAPVPTDGLYLCPDCSSQRRRNQRCNVFPPGTFKCCPTATEEGSSGVLYCAGCKGWYHAGCVGVGSGVLLSLLTLSSTKWYCPEPTCCEGVLLTKLKKK